jgi:2-dehydro-3-deoxyphosphogluconate aldolase/(4S)-4-hydroxy-2-oxoglutarate aldolase
MIFIITHGSSYSLLGSAYKPPPDGRLAGSSLVNAKFFKDKNWVAVTAKARFFAGAVAASK